MTRTRHIAVSLAAAVALVAPLTATASAQAAGPATTKTVKAQTKQLLKDIAGKDQRLARLVDSHAVAALADDTEAGLVDNLTEARESLADVKAAAQAADSTLDTRAVRKELRSFRVENFRLVVNVLRRVEALTDAAAADPEAQAFLAEAEAAALAVTATSPKADIKAARALLRDARAELEQADTEVAPAV